MTIGGLQKLTLLDFPGRTACTVFTPGCDFRCPYCHNAALVTRAQEQETMPQEEFFRFLSKRKGLLDGVAITGGEPTLQPGLEDFIGRVKSEGFLVKLDTNGTRPDVVRRLIDSGLVDYIAMDVKAAPENYDKVTGGRCPDIGPVRESVSLIMEGRTDYEFRTTLVKGLHTIDDMTGIGPWISGAKRYFLQNFKDSGDIISAGWAPFAEEELKTLLDAVLPYVPAAELRGVD